MKRNKLYVGGRGVNPEKWRPVMVRDALGVKALNSLFRKGWYLMNLEMEDLPCLAFQVATEGERPEKVRKTEVFIRSINDDQSSLLLILTKGTIHRQRALLLEPDEHGYRDFGRYAKDIEQVADGWDTLATFPMENRCYLAILEKPGEG